MTDEQELGSNGFADPTRALRMRDAIRRIAEAEVGKLTATQQVARVVSANLASMTAQVWIPGDPEPITVGMFQDLVPGTLGEQEYRNTSLTTSTTGTGSLVVIDKVGGKLYIIRVLSGGQFSHNLAAGGLVHKSFNAMPVENAMSADIWSVTPPVQGNYGLEVSFHAPSNGNAVMVGPFVGTSDGTFYPGHIKIYVSRWEDTYMFEANLRDEAIWRESSVGETRWMRLMPKMRGSWHEEFGLSVDIGLRSTFMLDKQGYNEIWLRFVDERMGAQFIYAHVEAYGPLVTYGHVDLNRLRCESTNDYEYSGFLGFHNSQFLFRAKEDEVGKTGPFVPTSSSYGGDIWDAPPSWMSGSWDSGGINYARDVARVWGCDGYFTWNGTALTWTNNLHFTGIGSSRWALPNGNYKVPVPTTGTVLPVIPNDMNFSPLPSPASVTVTSAGIPIPNGCTLYYGLPPAASDVPGDGFTNWHTKGWMFFLVNNNWSVTDTDFQFELPGWAIPIAHRYDTTAALHELRILAHGQELVDTTMFQVAQSTSSTGTLALNTEHVVQTITSFNFKAGAAYRVTAKTGWIINNPGTVNTTAASNTVINFRIRKGTTSAGADIGEFFRVPVTQGLGAVHHFYGETYIAPTSSASGSLVLTAALDWVNGADPANTPTMLMYGGVTRRWLEIEYAGPAARYPQATPY